MENQDDQHSNEQLEELKREKADMELAKDETIREMKKAAKERSKEDESEYQMLRPARLPVKPIYCIVEEVYPKIDELAEFVVQSYCNGRVESFGQCADQTDMTPNGEKKGRAFVTSKPGAEHPVIDEYLKWMQDKFVAFMHVHESGEFGAGFSVVITGWPKETPKALVKGDVKRWGEVMTKGYRTKTHTDYDAGRDTSYSCCTAIQDDALGILVNAQGQEEVIKLAKGQTIIFSSSLFHFGCNHYDFNMAYGIPYGE